MQSLAASASTLAASPQTQVALEAFADGHRELLSREEATTGTDREALVADYRPRYIEPLSPLGIDIQARDVIPANRAGIYLQARYAVTGERPIDSASIDDAGDGSGWSEVHAVLHPVFRDIADRLGVLDLYLIEPEGGYVVHSVKKRPDLGTSLVAGPFSGSGLATAVEQAERTGEGSAVTSDLGYYLPALSTPVGFVASPVFTGERMVGFVVLMYDGAPLNDLLSAGGEWDAAGFPPTGETLLFGRDGRVRTEPRSFVEDPEAHLRLAVETGLSDQEVSVARAAGTTVLLQSVPATTRNAAVAGDTSVTERPNLIGITALSTVSAVPIDGLDWFVLAEIQVDAAEESIDDFTELLIVGVAIIVTLLAFIAVAWASQLVRPIREIGEQLGGDSEDPIRVDVPARSPAEFHELAQTFESMADRIDEQQRLVAETRQERLELLGKMLPPTVAARVAAGQIQSVDDVPQATVAVLVVLGLGELVRADAPDASRQILNQLLADADELAERHQVDRVKVVGDAYFASCGHDRPLIDHAPRMLAFAIDAGEVVRELAADSSSLDVAVGIHSGPVLAGMTGGDRSVFDVWGETVTTAHYLARQAAQGQIVVSEATKTLLPDSVELRSDVSADGTRIWSVASKTVRSRR